MLNSSIKHLLFIEPYKHEKSVVPNDDELTLFMEEQLKNATICESWRGFHMTDCGERSTCHNYTIKGGYMTNSLAAFYLRWYRSSVPARDLLVIRNLLTDKPPILISK